VNEQLRGEIEELRKQLLAMQAAMAERSAEAASASAVEPQQKGGAGGSSLSDEQKAQMEELIANLERAKAQSWEERQKMSQLYEAERAANLANENKVRAVMQTIKEEKEERMRRVRALETEKARLRLDLRARKAARAAASGELAAAALQYQQEVERLGEGATELDALGAGVEALTDRAAGESAAMAKVRDDLKAVEQQLLEERAALVAQHSLLEEDASLRKAIVEEERKKLESANASILESQLAAEREKLREQAQRERQELLARVAASEAKGMATSEREQQLELALIDANTQLRLLVLESGRAAQAHAQALRRVRAEHRRSVEEGHREQLRVLRELTAGLEEERLVERAASEAKASEYRRLLAMAAKDVDFLTARCEDLERKLLRASAYEDR
jgi:hypothetical protein